MTVGRFGRNWAYLSGLSSTLITFSGNAATKGQTGVRAALGAVLNQDFRKAKRVTTSNWAAPALTRHSYSMRPTTLSLP